MSQTERIFYIDRMIREHGGVSARQMCDKFEVSSRQAKRDIGKEAFACNIKDKRCTGSRYCS